HQLQPGRRADREPRRRGVLHIPALGHRPARLRAGAAGEEGDGAEGGRGGSGMIKRRSRIARTLIVVGSAAPSILDGAKGLWRSEAGRKWLVPLVEIGRASCRERGESPGAESGDVDEHREIAGNI